MKKIITLSFLLFFNLTFSNNDTINIFSKEKIKRSSTKNKFHNIDSKILINEVFNTDGQTVALRPFLNNSSKLIKQNFVSSYFKLNTSSTQGDVMEKVKKLFNENIPYIDKIIGTELIQLPIGLQGSTTDNLSAKLVIVKAKVTPQYIELMAFAELKTPSMAIYFAAENLKLSHQGGVIGDWKLQLLANCSIPQIGNKFLLSVTGGTLDKESGNIVAPSGSIQQPSYIEFDCDGFKSFQFNVDIRLARSLAHPIGSDGKAKPYDKDLAEDKVLAVGNDNYVGAKIYASGTGWQDLLLKLNLPKFESPKLKGWHIEIKDLVLDLSDTRNDESFYLPEIYTLNPSFFPNGDIKTWRGVYAKNIEVSLPKQFNNASGTNKTVITASHMIIDNSGVTGNFSAVNVLEFGKANGWHFTLDYVGLGLELGQFRGAKFIGGIKPAGIESFFRISGSYNNGNYLFRAAVEEANMPLFKGKLMFQSGSYVQLEYSENDDEFKASAKLSGNLNIKGSPSASPITAITPNNSSPNNIAVNPYNQLNTSIAGDIIGNFKGDIVTEAENYVNSAVSWIPSSVRNKFASKDKIQKLIDKQFDKGIIEINDFVKNKVKSISEKFDKNIAQQNASTTSTITNQQPNNNSSSTNVALQDDENALFQANSIVFQNLRLNSYQKPYIQADYFGYTGTVGTAGSFPLTFENIYLYTEDNGDTVGLNIKVNVNLMENAGISGTSTFKIIGKFEQGTYQNFKFDRLLCSGISIDIQKSGFELKGFVNSFTNDPEYGTGFEGGISVKFEKLKVTGGARALFCKKTERFWYVDFDITNNDSGNSKFKILKVVGGLSYKMKRNANASAFGTANVAYKYAPSVGMSYKAGVSAKFGSTKSFAAKVYLEMEFNTTGGLNRIYFLGEGAMMHDKSETPESTAVLGQVLTKKEQLIDASAQLAQDFLNATNSGNFLAAAKSIHPKSEIAKGGKFGLYVSIEKCFEPGKESFDGLFEIYCNTEGFKGAGPDGLLGMVHLYSSPTKNYIHIGTPTRRLGAIFPVDPYIINVNAYFMTGDFLESQVIENSRIRTIFPGINNNQRIASNLDEGKGFAFGLDFRLAVGRDFGWFYAILEAGAGFDIMHRHYPGVSCRGMDGPIGNDGWYSMGNIYAYLWGEAGLRVKVLGKKRTFKILELGVGAVLKGAFPNPTHMEGRLGVHYNVMGGLIKGTYNFKAEMGTKCDMIGMTNPLSIPIISNVSPENEQNVDVFKKPQVAFNYKMMTPFTAEDADGNPKTIRVFLKKFVFKEGANIIPGEVQWTENNGKVDFISSEVLPPQTDINATVVVGIEENINGNWVAFGGDANASETKTFTFKTDNAPEYIPMNNILYTYPVVNMNNFYPNEHKNVYIKLKQGQGYLFNGSVVNWTLKGEVHENNILKYTNNLSYDSTRKMVNFVYDGLETAKNYRLRLMAYPPGNAPATAGTTINLDDAVGAAIANNDSALATANDYQSITSNTASAQNNTAINKEFLTYIFKSSNYITFADKMASINATNFILETISTDVQTIHMNTQVNEMFEKIELIGSEFTNDKPLITSITELPDNYFYNYISPLLYQNYPLDNDIHITYRDISIFGLPPTKSVDIPPAYRFWIENQPTSIDVKTRFPFRYNASMVYREDYGELKYKLINKLSIPTINQQKMIQYSDLINNSFRPIFTGTYRLKVFYKLLDDLHSSSSIINFIRN